MDKKYKCQLDGVEYEIKKIDSLDKSYENCLKKYQAILIQTDGIPRNVQDINHYSNSLNSWQDITTLISKVRQIENSVLIMDEKQQACFVQLKGDNVLSFQNTQVAKDELNKNQYYFFEICHTKQLTTNSHLHTTHKVDKKNTITDREAVVQVH